MADDSKAFVGPVTVGCLTPPGSGGVAVIQIAGDGAMALLARLGGVPGGRVPPVSRPVLRTLVHDGEALDEALVHRRGDGSGVELALHGGPAVVEGVLAACVRLGASRITPGTPGRRDRLVAALAEVQAPYALQYLWPEVEGRLPKAAARWEAAWERGAADRAAVVAWASARLRWKRLVQALLESPPRVLFVGRPNAGRYGVRGFLSKHGSPPVRTGAV